MRFEFNEADLAPLIQQVVATTIDQLQSDQERLNGRIGYLEGEAASQLGLPSHSLRDARLRGEISASKCGSRIIYSRDELISFLQRNRL